MKINDVLTKVDSITVKSSVVSESKLGSKYFDVLLADAFHGQLT